MIVLLRERVTLKARSMQRRRNLQSYYRLWLTMVSHVNIMWISYYNYISLLLNDNSFLADNTVKSVNMKTANLVPQSSNVRKKLLHKTSLAKNLPPADKARLKSSTPLMRSKPIKSDAAVKKSKVSKSRPPRLEGISKEEEAMALNLSQEPGNFSKIVSDQSLW